VTKCRVFEISVAEIQIVDVVEIKILNWMEYLVVHVEELEWTTLNLSCI